MDKYDWKCFAEPLSTKAEDLLVPGKGFNWGQPDHFRIVYLPRVEVLTEAGMAWLNFWMVTDRSKIYIR